MRHTINHVNLIKLLTTWRMRRNPHHDRFKVQARGSGQYDNLTPSMTASRWSPVDDCGRAEGTRLNLQQAGTRWYFGYRLAPCSHLSIVSLRLRLASRFCCVKNNLGFLCYRSHIVFGVNQCGLTATIGTRVSLACRFHTGRLPEGFRKGHCSNDISLEALPNGVSDIAHLSKFKSLRALM